MLATLVCAVVLVLAGTASAQTTAAPTCSITSIKTPAFFSLDNAGTVYANGVLIGSPNNWQVTFKASIPANAIIAMNAQDWGVIAGILGSWGPQVTDETWKCTKVRPNGTSWTLPNFDDSAWPRVSE
jgi:hypothetical protein